MQGRQGTVRGVRHGGGHGRVRRGLRLAPLLLVLTGPAAAQEAAPAARPATPVAEPADAAEPAPPPEPAWVRGELKLNFRATPSPTATAMGIVATGDQVLVLERKGAWARIRVASGESGWLPESALMAEAPPVERVAQLERELASVREELAVAQSELETRARRDEELQARSEERERLFEQLEEENRDLRAGERWPYLITGASLLGAGLTAGFLLRGGPSRRGGGRIRF